MKRKTMMTIRLVFGLCWGNDVEPRAAESSKKSSRKGVMI
jgi:hypothetical protein